MNSSLTTTAPGQSNRALHLLWTPPPSPPPPSLWRCGEAFRRSALIAPAQPLTALVASQVLQDCRGIIQPKLHACLVSRPVITALLDCCTVSAATCPCYCLRTFIPFIPEVLHACVVALRCFCKHDLPFKKKKKKKKKKHQGDRPGAVLASEEHPACCPFPWSQLTTNAE